MKIIFLFMSKGNAEPGSTKTDDWKHQRCSPNYQKIYGDECYFTLFKSLFDAGTITDLKVFFESNVDPGIADFVKNAQNFVIPEIGLVEEYIDADTIIFVRGGFKHWHNFLYKYKNTNWLICYAANTGRDKWKWWDIVFDDLNMQNIVDKHDRYQFPFIKPTNEEIFGLMAGPIEYDICIGASNIHDKKGQWKTVELMEEFHRVYGYYLRAVMPGGTRRATKTLEMLEKPFFTNEVHLPGMLSKPELNELFSACKVFLHLGTGGQNDRSILEAHSCGMPVCLSNTSRFSPLLKHDSFSTHVFDPDKSITEWAAQLYTILHDLKVSDKIGRHKIFLERMGYQEVALPMIKILFETLKGTKPSIEIKQKCVDSINKFLGRKENE